MYQHDSLPTHNSSHILNLIVTNASSNLVICPYMLDTYILDQNTVCVDIDFLKPTVNKVTFSYRSIYKINFNEFNQDTSVRKPTLCILCFYIWMGERIKTKGKYNYSLYIFLFNFSL